MHKKQSGPKIKLIKTLDSVPPQLYIYISSFVHHITGAMCTAGAFSSENFSIIPISLSFICSPPPPQYRFRSDKHYHFIVRTIWLKFGLKCYYDLLYCMSRAVADIGGGGGVQAYCFGRLTSHIFIVLEQKTITIAPPLPKCPPLVPSTAKFKANSLALPLEDPTNASPVPLDYF